MQIMESNSTLSLHIAADNRLPTKPQMNSIYMCSIRRQIVYMSAEGEVGDVPAVIPVLYCSVVVKREQFASISTFQPSPMAESIV